MSKSLAVIVIHGMGDTRPDYDKKLKSNVLDRLGDSRLEKISWHSVYYQHLLQANQKRFLDACIRNANVDWLKLRRFVLYGFSDAATMQYQPDKTNSMYHQIQEIIHDSLVDALEALENPQKPVLIVAHSLGCQVISNYIWDAQHSNIGTGVFREDIRNPIGTHSAEDKFLRLKTLEFLFTSGCNIPIFVAGLPKNKIKPILVNSRGWQFTWQNYYDPDDALGWPLKPLSREYRVAVSVDKDINVGNPLNSWNPMSHTAYWRDADFLDPLETALRRLL